MKYESRRDGFRVTARDGGAGFGPQTFLESGPCADRGYGIGIMRRTIDTVEFLGGGRTVTMVKHFSASQRAALGASA